jgi:hypothetical protein
MSSRCRVELCKVGFYYCFNGLGIVSYVTVHRYKLACISITVGVRLRFIGCRISVKMFYVSHVLYVYYCFKVEVLQVNVLCYDNLCLWCLLLFVQVLCVL